MLHTQTIERSTLELLEEMMKDPRLDDFSLVGGTALALYMGHRMSIDLDLFSSKSFDTNALERYLSDRYGFVTDFVDVDTLKGQINGVKVDMITYGYPLLRPLIKEGDIRLYCKEDIAAMKLSAIGHNGTRIKDFIDIAFLSTEMPLAQMLDGYKEKFPKSNPMIALRGLSSFERIILGEEIHLLKGDYSWRHIQKRLADMINNPEKRFVTQPVVYKRSETQPILKPERPQKILKPSDRPIIPPKKKKGRGM